jgi:hypothetical protein
MARLNRLKIIFGVVLVLVLASNVLAISRWSESRGVYDDICYLRQAHLFQRFGAGGLDTNLAKDDDHYLAQKLQAIDFPGWNDPARVPCHTLMPASNKFVLQYPPGTGFVLALFPSGFQVIPLYMLTSAVIFGFALLALVYASTLSAAILAGTFGTAASYLMINPTKASYSVAPTMIVCALAGFLTARLPANGNGHRFALTAAIGLLIGVSVNFRLPNLFLSAGYFLFFLIAFLGARRRDTLLRGISFGVAFLIGMMPTLVANAINAGSPFATTYGGVDVAPPELKSEVLWQYLRDPQFILLLIAAGWTAVLWRGRTGAGQVAPLVGANLVVNLIFFMTHPVFTPYYTIPVAMLSLWTLLFATLGPHAAEAVAPAPAQPAKARSK